MQLEQLAEVARQLSNDDFLLRFTSPFLLQEGGSEAQSAREVFELAQPVLRVGRNPKFEIALLRAAVSARHAELRWTAAKQDVSGGWHAVDLGSTNGTYVDAERLSPGVARRLVINGSVIGFGPLRFSFLSPHSMLGVLRRLELMSAEFDPSQFADLRAFESDATNAGKPQGVSVGRLSADSLRRLLKGFDRGQRSGTVIVFKETSNSPFGQVGFRFGKLVDASTREGLRGIDAVKALLEVSPGRYFYDPLPPEGALSTALSEILHNVERRQSRVALALSEAQLRATVENAFHGIVACTDLGQVLSLNPSATAMFGREQASVSRLAELLRSEDDSDPTPHLLSSRGEDELHELLGVRQGATFPIEVAVTRVEVPGQPRTWSLALQDLTERKRAEATLREAQTALHQAQKMDAVGRLAAGITHDFNNLLSVINGYSELLRDEMQGRNRERVEAVLEAGLQAAELTKSLLTFCKRETSSPQPQAINAVIQELTGVLGRLLGPRNLLLVHPGKNLAEVLVDKVQLEQLLMNLIVNAREAMPNGGEIHVATANVVVTDLVDVEPGDYVRLTVSDTGTGIPPDVLPHLFEPFFTTKETGTGLGLATVYGVVRQSGGYVKVHSELGLGTTFSIYLPRHVTSQQIKLTPTPEAASAERGHETQISRWQTVLVVEDQEGVLQFVTEVLQQNGYLVLKAEDGQEGLEHYEAYGERIDLLLTDVLMPRLSGVELVERVRAIDPGQRVLYMSATADVRTLGGQPFLPKPLSADSLLAAVDGALDSFVE